ncbi:MAG: nucleotidyl transferase AbiEii/AbiGii toxin family protein [Burkholderiales bacterium]|nr:nucleotidyl transferase AbiEii/AbiGii toxin family protein [Nitrosomonas sp.]MCP5273501.1 nucleotidyl transferase AbiEii/AbiGii toxin family protein [Burkholderiales bacterium]
MPTEIYLHEHSEFYDLLNIVADELKIDPYLVEKDYWIMHCLYSLKQAGYDFQLKGGTSLSKGYGIIHRFSEDIDLHITPPADLEVKTSRNHNKEQHRESRRKYYDYLSKNIKISGIVNVGRDTAFDSLPGYFSGGIRLYYEAKFPSDGSAKEGVLLEAGFDDVIPNQPLDITSWAFDFAKGKNVAIIDNRALQIPCYDPGYTLVEKLQSIATKFRQQQEDKRFSPNFMRHYYDVFCLLQDNNTQKFIGMEAYEKHKKRRFPRKDLEIPLNKNEAFLLQDKEMRELYRKEYEKRPGLYYQGQPPFEDILKVIRDNIDWL